MNSYIPLLSVKLCCVFQCLPYTTNVVSFTFLFIFVFGYIAASHVSAKEREFRCKGYTTIRADRQKSVKYSIPCYVHNFPPMWANSYYVSNISVEYSQAKTFSREIWSLIFEGQGEMICENSKLYKTWFCIKV